jgi:K+ transporter
MNIDIWLPILLLIFAFLLKLFISREVGWPDFFESLCELPVDVMFLSISFITVSVISVKHDHSSGMLVFIILNIVLIPVILIWRSSRKKLDDQKKSWIIFTSLNLLFTSFIALYSLNQVKLNLNRHDNEIKKEVDDQSNKSNLHKKIKSKK